MEGWVDLGSLIAVWPGIEPTTAGSQVRRPNRYATKTLSGRMGCCAVMAVLCLAKKLTSVNARVNYDQQTQSDVDRQYRALAELVNILFFLLYFVSK